MKLFRIISPIIYITLSLLKWVNMTKYCLQHYLLSTYLVEFLPIVLVNRHHLHFHCTTSSDHCASSFGCPCCTSDHCKKMEKRDRLAEVAHIINRLTVRLITNCIIYLPHFDYLPKTIGQNIKCKLKKITLQCTQCTKNEFSIGYFPM